MKPHDRQRLTTGQVAQMAHCARMTVTRAIQAGDLPAEKAGPFYTVTAGDAQAWVDQYRGRNPTRVANTIPSTASRRRLAGLS